MEQRAKLRMRWAMAVSMTVTLVYAGLCGHPAVAQQKKPTAREVVAAIQEHVGIPWEKETVDTFKAGNPDTPVTGIAVTMMATLDVLQRAAAKGQNFVITHEPTFYNHLDVPGNGRERSGVERETRVP
jgi:hypothetical protein